MSSKAERIMDSIREQCGEEIYDDIIATNGFPDEQKSPAKQARYVQSVLRKVEALAGGDAAARAMRPCGHLCVSEKARAVAARLYAEAESLDAFLEALNREGLGGGHLRREGEKIVGIYKECYCGLAKAAKDMPRAYCQCSAGWFEALFSAAVGHRVKVTPVETIVGGAKECRFDISI